MAAKWRLETLKTHCTAISEVKALKDYTAINDALALIEMEKEKLYDLEGIDLNNALERAFVDCLHSYENVIFLKNGRRNRATYVRRSWAKYGIKETIERLVMKASTKGFNTLQEENSIAHSFEMLVVRYHKYFDPKLVSKALSKIDP